MIVVIVTKLLYTAGLHMVFSILAGLVLAALVLALMTKKIPGIVLSIACSLLWTIIFGEDFAQEIYDINNDKIWMWAIRIFSFLLFFVYHFACMIETKEDVDFTKSEIDDFLNEDENNE